MLTFVAPFCECGESLEAHVLFFSRNYNRASEREESRLKKKKNRREYNNRTSIIKKFLT